MFRNTRDIDVEHDYNQRERNTTRELPTKGSFKEIETGAGNRTFKQDRRGMWLGSTQMEDAPFSVDMNGVMKMRAKQGDAQFVGLDPTQGIWLGAENFADAPFSVDLEGNMKIKASAFTQDMSMEWEDAAGNLGIYLGFKDI